MTLRARLLSTQRRRYRNARSSEWALVLLLLGDRVCTSQAAEAVSFGALGEKTESKPNEALRGPGNKNPRSSPFSSASLSCGAEQKGKVSLPVLFIFIIRPHGRGQTMASFSNCTWATLAHADWAARVTARRGTDALVVFSGPQGTEETRAVPVERLGLKLRAQLERVAPRRRPAPQLKTRFC